MCIRDRQRARLLTQPQAAKHAPDGEQVGQRQVLPARAAQKVLHCRDVQCGDGTRDKGESQTAPGRHEIDRAKSHAGEQIVVPLSLIHI